MTTIQQLYDELIKRKYLGHALALETMGINMKADLTKELLDNINAKVENVVTAIDQWRYENEDQYDEDDEDFNNWYGDPLEIQECMQDSKITLEDLKSWGLI